MKRSPIQLTQDLGVDFWNDSCHLKELGEAVAEGAVGATSNPVIVGAAVEGDPETWLPVLRELIRSHPRETEEEIAWRLIEAVGERAARLLHHVYNETEGRKGFLCVQVNPKLYRDGKRMAQHGKRLASIADNIAVKVPATAEGLVAVEALTASGVPVNATVSFTVSQAVACAEAMERGLTKAKKKVQPYVTLMVGRLDDLLKRAMERDKVSIEPGLLQWAGIAVFKKARVIFKKRGFGAKLLAAAYRHHLHWSELIGSGVVQSIPYNWWRQFNASDVAVARTLDRPVAKKTVEALCEGFADFRKAYDEGALKPQEFVSYGASTHTLDQFIAGYEKLLALVRREIFLAS